jgi:hypothetical protein
MEFIRIIVCVFAVFGLITLIHSLPDGKMWREKIDSQHIRHVLLVKNSEEYIEQIIYNTLKNSPYGSIDSKKPVTIVDLDSTDETLKILKQMEKYGDQLNVVEYKDRENIFTF